MLIGELAERVGTSARMLRYYEQQGLVRSRRSANGYRVYDEHEVDVVRKIRDLLELGFDLADTQPFVTCLRGGNGSGDECPESVESLRRKLAEIDDAIARLGAARRHLTDRIDAVTGPPPKCAFTC
ncbi:MerR family transcriptional regulator [Nocardia africana]|uniref:Copper export regulator n=1 Tax=Nocardia africana TaxID=134964 RepID=A0A378WQ39_9NOCA|nr:MerR family transcriptional regulator [Nocardia africana]MCC3315257.1 MerR family transcriptional regulator [Nocardia africana]SUA42443.1 Copper export regulator [Nocardia africana]